MPTMLILRGIAGHFDGKDWPRGALYEEPALEYARRRGYDGRVLDVAGTAAGAVDTRPQVRAALAAIDSDPSIAALYGFSGGGYNLVHIIARMSAEQRQRIKLVVVLGAPQSPRSLYEGGWELVYRNDPTQGHMAGPQALLEEFGSQTMPNESMKMSPAGLNLVKHFESCLEPVGGGRFKAYVDPVGVLTIGWGHTNDHGRKFDRSSIWTQKECDDELASDMSVFETEVKKNVKTELTQGQFDALVSFAYNVGGGALASSTLLRRVNSRDFVGAAPEFHRWNKGGGRVLPGLTRRRASESLLFQGVLDANYDGKPDSGAPVGKPDIAPTAPASQPDFFAAMRALGIEPTTTDGELNILYVDNMNLDYTANDGRHNTWCAVRLVLGHDGRVLGRWKATVRPGDHYVESRINPKGAASIKQPGEYRAWQVGIHRNHEALVQTGGPVTVTRDNDENFNPLGDAEDTGYFGINQHWGYDLPTPDRASAGCLVGQSTAGHREFMAMVKRDRRYVEDKKYVFSTTILPASAVPDKAPDKPAAAAASVAGWFSKLWGKA